MALRMINNAFSYIDAEAKKRCNINNHLGGPVEMISAPVRLI